MHQTGAAEKRVLTYLSKRLNLKDVLKLQQELGLPISFQAADKKNAPEKVYQTIKKWTHDPAVKATYKKLNTALANIGRQDLQGIIVYVCFYIDIFGNKYSSPSPF